MRVSSVVLVLVLSVCAGGLGVQVKVGDRSFPLEAVKRLKELMGSDESVGPRLAESSVASVCSDPLLPRVFQPVCRDEGAGVVLSRLVYIITPVDPCEICSYPACYGCLD